jgi:hypothetical protein
MLKEYWTMVVGVKMRERDLGADEVSSLPSFHFLYITSGCEVPGCSTSPHGPNFLPRRPLLSKMSD